MRVLAVIPAYNEESGIGTLLDRLLVQGLLSPRDILVVDDGSTDRTSAFALERGVRVIRHPVNLGKGVALLNGFKIALSENYEAVLTMDADLQHPPERVKDLLRAVKDRWDIVIGSRFKNFEGMPYLNYLSNRLTTLILSLIVGRKLEDTQSGFRAIKREVLMRVKLKTRHFDLESEMIARAARMGFKIGVVPIETIYGREKSHVNKVLDTLRFMRLIFLLSWR